MIASSLQKDTVLAALMIEPAMRAWSAKVAPVARWTHGDQLRRFATLVMVDMRGLQIDWPYALRPDREARRAVCDPAFLAFPAGSLFAGPRQLAAVAREQSETFPCGTPCTVGRKYGMLTESKWLVVLPAC